MLAETRKRARILIVDDQESNVLLLQRLLQQVGYTTLESTTDPRVGLRLFSEFQPDLVLLDLMMPHLDGLAVMRELANRIALEDYLPILVLTAGEGPMASRAGKISKAAERCARIVKNFLALARQQPMERQLVSLNRVVEEAVELLAYALRVDSVETTLELAPDLPDIWADPHQLHQVVVNLVSNAHQAMRAIDTSRRIILTTRLDAASGRVQLEVADTGPGIPEDVQR